MVHVVMLDAINVLEQLLISVLLVKHISIMLQEVHVHVVILLVVSALEVVLTNVHIAIVVDI